MTKKHLLALAALLATACGSSIEPDQEQDTPDPAQADDAGAPLGEQGEPFELTIDATDTTSWVYLDLESRKTVTPATPQQSGDWDLALRRFALATNGGASGAGGVQVAVVPGSFEALNEAPASGFASDLPDGKDEDLDPDWIMSTGDTGWYDYDPSNHTLSPRAHVYVVRTVEGSLFKLAVLDYYNDAGSPAHVRLRVQLLARGDGDVTLQDAGAVQEPPEPVDAGPSEADAALPDGADAGLDAGGDAGSAPVNYETLTVSASGNTWVRVKVGEGVVQADATSSDWDIAFQRTMIQSNSGTSGQGMAGAQLLVGDFASLEQAPTREGFVVDAELPAHGPPGSGTFSGNAVLSAWFDYDRATHAVTPKDAAFVVRTASGGYAKLRITAWSNGEYTLDLGMLSAP